MNRNIKFITTSSHSVGLRSNVITLAMAQGLFTAAVAIDLTLTGLTGYELAPDKFLATLPFALITVAGAVTTYFASMLMAKIGRSKGFILGSLIGGTGGLVSTCAVLRGDFWLFCLGTAAVGVFQAFAQYYRLAAADTEQPAYKARAISLVLAGGVIAAFLGPLLARWSKDLLTTLFAGSYLAVGILGFASAALLWLGYRDCAPTETVSREPVKPSRSLSEIFMTPISLAALGNNVIGGVVMMFIMTAAPLAAVSAHHTIDDGASIIQWHLVGMYAPSLFAGRIISRFGSPCVLFVGMALNVTSAVVANFSDSLTSFYCALLLLGIGWNFMFVGGTALLTASHNLAERARVQGVAELMRYSFTALATLAAGPLLDIWGWAAMNLMCIPLIMSCAILTLRWVLAEKT